jgi:hypothetical protein
MHVYRFRSRLHAPLAVVWPPLGSERPILGRPGLDANLGTFSELLFVDDRVPLIVKHDEVELLDLRRQRKSARRVDRVEPINGPM